MSEAETRGSDRPIEPIVCAGSPYEIGLAQGRGAREQVRSSVGLAAALDSFRNLKPRCLPFGAFRRLAERKVSKLWDAAVDPATPSMSARVRGIAAGAGANQRSIRLLNVLEPMMSDLREQTEMPPMGGCSALAVTRSRSATGEAMVARNFDFLKIIQPYYVMRDTRPEGGLRSLDFTAAPIAGAADGMNEAGLCVSVNYAYVQDEPVHGQTVTMAVCEALARCRTVQEAAEFLSAAPRWGGGILMLADAAGDIGSLEMSNQRAELRRPESGRDVLFHTNHFHTAEMREVEVHRDATYGERAPLALRGQPVHGSAEKRWRRLEELVAQRGALGPQDLGEVMADHGPTGEPSLDTVCMHSDYWFTTASLQLFPKRRMMRVAFGTACEGGLVELEVG